MNNLEEYITVYFYGRLRKLGTHRGPQGEHIAYFQYREGSRIKDILTHYGLVPEEISHLFLNGVYSNPTRRLSPGDRLGVFARDMHLLYRQYFPVAGEEDD